MVDRAAGAPLKKLTPLQTSRADIESVPTFCFCPARQKLHLLYYLLFLIFYLYNSSFSLTSLTCFITLAFVGPP